MSAFFWPEFAILFAAGLIGIACVAPYTLELTADAFKKARQRMRRPRPKWVLVLLQIAQSVVLVRPARGIASHYQEPYRLSWLLCSCIVATP